MIYADQRWIGNHGIGRFARHVLAGLDYQPIPITSHPAAPLDSWRLAQALKGGSHKDLFFSPGYNTPLFCSGPFVFTIHDLSHVYCSENSSLPILLYYATIMKRACRRAAKILTVSDFTRAQIVEWSGVPSEKVQNVGCGVDAKYRPEGEPYGLPFRYMLCVSNRKTHKNEFRTVAAFAKAAIDPEIRLVFTGEPTPTLTKWIEQQQVASRIVFLGVVAEEQLPALYRGAESLIFASLYEGFGLPVLEAMACGTPVLTSNVTAMPETAGGAALLVNPTSIDQLSQAITQIVGDRCLRAQLREKGLRRAAHFQWEDTAGKVHEQLRAVQ